MSCPPKSCSLRVGMMHNSFGTGPSTRLLVMCMLVEMPSLVPSPLSPQPAGSIKGGGRFKWKLSQLGGTLYTGHYVCVSLAQVEVSLAAACIAPKHSVSGLPNACRCVLAQAQAATLMMPDQRLSSQHGWPKFQLGPHESLVQPTCTHCCQKWHEAWLHLCDSYQCQSLFDTV